jgi:hypothetical protein
MSPYFRVDIAASAVTILVGLLQLAAYAGWVGNGPVDGVGFFIRLAGSVGLIVVLSVAVAIVAAILDRDSRDLDERERQLHFRASGGVSATYAAGLVLLMLSAFRPLSPMQLAHAVIAIFVVGEAVRLAGLAVHMARRV